MSLLSSLDPIKTQISRSTSYSTTLGKILAVLVSIVLCFTFLYKILEMIQRNNMYLNSIDVNDRSPVFIGDYQFHMSITSQQNSSTIDITYDNQHHYGINVTFVKVTLNITEQKLQRNHKQGPNYPISPFKIDGETKKPLISITPQLPSQLEDIDIKVQFFPMEACKDQPLKFCTPDYVLSLMNLQGYWNQDQIVRQYHIVVTPCWNKSICNKPLQSKYNITYDYKCTRIQIQQKSDNQVIKQCFMRTGRSVLIDPYEPKNKFYYNNLKKLIVKTHDASIAPSFIYKLMGSQNLNTTYLWQFENQQSFQINYEQAQVYPHIQIAFERTGHTITYQRRFNDIDTVLAEVFGLSAFIGLLIRFLFADYAKWEADSFIVASIAEDNSYQGTFYSYLKYKIRKICQKCKCCKRQKVDQSQQQQNLNQFDANIQKQQILKKANSNVNIIQITRKFNLLQQKIYILEASLRNQERQKNKGNIEVEQDASTDKKSEKEDESILVQNKEDQLNQRLINADIQQ